MSEKAIKTRKSWRVRGAEWIVLGGAVAGLAWFAPVIAPALVALYGVYRWIKSGSYNQGLFIIAGAVLMTVLLLGPLRGLFWPLKWIGAVMIAGGALAMMIPSAKEELTDSQVIEITAQSDDEE
ncbi:MAG: hypothetical protein RRB13_06290 [bacterium]|nr:hypothetical protein [bacterium]